MKKIDILKQSIKEEIQSILKEENKIEEASFPGRTSNGKLKNIDKALQVIYPYMSKGDQALKDKTFQAYYRFYNDGDFNSLPFPFLKTLGMPEEEIQKMKNIKQNDTWDKQQAFGGNNNSYKRDYNRRMYYKYQKDNQDKYAPFLEKGLELIMKYFINKYKSVYREHQSEVMDAIKGNVNEDAFELTGSTGKKTLATFKNPSDANQFKTQNPNIKQVTKLEENEIQDEALKIIRDTLFNYITELKEIKYGNIIPLATDILNNLNEKDYFITKSNNISEAKDEELQEGDIVFFDGKKVKLVEIRGDKYFIKSISNPGRPAEWVRKSDLSKTSLKSLKPTNEAKDEDEPEIKDDWNKEDKEDTSTDDETIDKTATKGAKKSKSKAEKLDFVIKNLKQCETDIKELVNKWKLAKTDEEKQPLINQLKEKNKLKKELEELQDLYSDTLVKESEYDYIKDKKTYSAKVLSDFFRVPLNSLLKFNFDGNDNLEELTKVLNSTSIEGTELYYKHAIEMAERDLD